MANFKDIVAWILNPASQILIHFLYNMTRIHTPAQRTSICLTIYLFTHKFSAQYLMCIWLM